MLSLYYQNTFLSNFSGAQASSIDTSAPEQADRQATGNMTCVDYCYEPTSHRSTLRCTALYCGFDVYYNDFCLSQCNPKFETGDLSALVRCYQDYC